MKIDTLTLMLLALLSVAPLMRCGSVAADTGSPTTLVNKTPLDPQPTEKDAAQRRAEAIQSIQDALDEDPDEAAKFLGATHVTDLDLESLEALGDKAQQFVQQKMFEQQQEQREERARIRDLQNLQNARH